MQDSGMYGTGDTGHTVGHLEGQKISLLTEKDKRIY